MYKNLKENVRKFFDSLGSDGNRVKIVAATKTVPAEIINLLPSLGIFTAGENRVQELLSKYDDVTGVDWHFIGNLQTNKVKYIVDKVVMIESVDRLELAMEIDRRCAKLNKKMPVLIEINIGNEESKGGIAADKADELAAEICRMDFLELKGIMCVPPIGAPKQIYLEAKEISDRFKDKYSADILSMGMSEDYITAFECGANILRPGRILFGERIYK